MNCTLGVPHCDRASHHHTWQAEMVEGPGTDLPGLLGLDSLETINAILVIGDNNKLTRWRRHRSPTSARHCWKHLVLPPSCQLCVIIDRYEKLSKEACSVIRQVSLKSIPITCELSTNFTLNLNRTLLKRNPATEYLRRLTSNVPH